MVVQYAFNISNVRQDNFFDELRKKISNQRDRRIDNFYFEKDRIRCLYAEILLRYALSEFGIENDSILIECDINGKPTLTNAKNIFFNLSHSGDWIVCALSSSEVGIDVEEIKDNQIMDISRNCLTDLEYSQLCDCEQCEQLSKFYSFWTLKESYVKNIGLGMEKSLLDFEFVLDSPEIKLFINGEECLDYHFEQYYIDEKHQVAICTKEANINKCIIIEFEQLRKWIG